ncbi:hypothetical protein C7N43_38945, partial [Sphingobacteriales bacterium UPWRP_1]
MKTAPPNSPVIPLYSRLLRLAKAARLVAVLGIRVVPGVPVVRVQVIPFYRLRLLLPAKAARLVAVRGVRVDLGVPVVRVQ